MNSVHIVIVLFNIFLTINAFTQLSIKKDSTKHGFVFPNRAEPNNDITFVLEGADFLIYLTKVPKDFATCKLTSPDISTTYILNSESSDPNEKVSFWSPNLDIHKCGARIKNLNAATDSGRWRLQAFNGEGNYRFQSFINLRVIKQFERPNEHFVMREGKEYELNVTYLANYCAISSPNIDIDNNIFDRCQIDIESAKRLYGGKWKASVGVYGQIDEILLEPNITVIEEQFDVGTNETKGPLGTKINLFCNLKNPVNTTKISICRFTRDGNDIGLRLSSGLSNGKYSYFGNSLEQGDCGVTIEKPQTSDYVSWKCTVGVYIEKNKTVVYEVKESIISLSKKTRHKRDSRDANTNEMKEILAGFEHPLVFDKKTDFRIKYCIIKHPNGTMYSINRPVSNGDWKTVGNIDAGECKMIIRNATIEDNGVWVIQLGDYDITETDHVEKVQVRVNKEALVSVKQNIIGTEDEQVTLKCQSVTTLKELEYCRFTLPDNQGGFHIGEHITQNRSINGTYWYNGSSLKNGDCQVTIQHVQPNHFGTWSCSGKILDSVRNEDTDYITLTQGDAGLTIASISGIVVGSALAVILFGGAIIFCRKRGKRQPQRRQTFLSQSSHSSGEVTHFHRPDPMISIEEEAGQISPPQEEIEFEDIRSTTSVASISGREIRATTPGASSSRHSESVADTKL